MRKISRRNFLLASGAVTISAALSACGGSSSSVGAASSAAASSAASDAPAAQGKVLNIWCWNDEFQGRFNNYYPEVASIAEDKSTTTLKDGTVVKWTINANENNNYQNKLDEALLNQIRLVNILNRNTLFPDGSGNRIDSHRTSVKAFNNTAEDFPVQSFKTKLIYTECLKCLSCNFHIYYTISFHL